MKWEDLREVGRKSGYKALSIWQWQSDDCLLIQTRIMSNQTIDHYIWTTHQCLHPAKEYGLEGESLLLLQHQSKDKPIV